MGRIAKPEANSVTWTDHEGNTWLGKYYGDPAAEVYVDKDASGRWIITNRPVGVDPFYLVEKVEPPKPDSTALTNIASVPDRKNWSLKKRVTISCLILAPASCLVCASAVAYGTKFAVEIIENWPK